MDENRIGGTARKYGGRVQEGVGSVTSDAKTRVEGAMNEAAGAAQQLYGQTSDVARETATTLDTWLRNAIETQPYTTAIVALSELGSAAPLAVSLAARSVIGRKSNKTRVTNSSIARLSDAGYSNARLVIAVTDRLQAGATKGLTPKNDIVCTRPNSASSGSQWCHD